ncbi:ATP-dependent helicase/nuclease subunit A [Striga asiatica]|uniref:ATP-dependent helicase/nuclease subunit A n=1 Tax=Striga asiatica TaxID=4170 RepID=A0A5A7QI14_STRAF|nr:ATP-dependent helicase/nuclease subunit A [Striga asiatica]
MYSKQSLISIHNFSSKTQDPKTPKPNDKLSNRTRSSAAASPQTRQILDAFSKAVGSKSASDLRSVALQSKSAVGSLQELVAPSHLHQKATFSSRSSPTRHKRVQDSDAPRLAVPPPAAFVP